MIKKIAKLWLQFVVMAMILVVVFGSVSLLMFSSTLSWWEGGLVGVGFWWTCLAMIINADTTPTEDGH